MFDYHIEASRQGRGEVKKMRKARAKFKRMVPLSIMLTYEQHQFVLDELKNWPDFSMGYVIRQLIQEKIALRNLQKKEIVKL